MAANAKTRSRAELTALRRGVIVAYRWLTLGFLLAGGIQISLAGLGVFSFRDQDAAAGSSAFDAHQALGFTMGGVTVVILIAALIARPGVLPTCLADTTALYGGLRAQDGLLALGIAGFLYVTARTWRP